MMITNYEALIIQFFPVSVIPSPLGPKNSTLESPQPTFFPLR